MQNNPVLLQGCFLRPQPWKSTNIKYQLVSLKTALSLETTLGMVLCLLFFDMVSMCSWPETVILSATVLTVETVTGMRQHSWLKHPFSTIVSVFPPVPYIFSSQEQKDAGGTHRLAFQDQVLHRTSRNDRNLQAGKADKDFLLLSEGHRRHQLHRIYFSSLQLPFHTENWHM